MREIKRDIVGNFILSVDDKILLGHNVKGGVFDDKWGVSGGGIEPGETTKEAAIREAKEELGLDISKASLSFFDTTFSAKAEKTLRDNGERVLVDMLFHDVIVRLDKKAADVVIVCEDDFETARFFSSDELPVLNIAPPTRRRLVELGMIDETLA